MTSFIEQLYPLDSQLIRYPYMRLICDAFIIIDSAAFIR